MVEKVGRKAEQGFTLIELMIVVLIIAILIAIAIPTFLGARRRSQDAQAKSHVRAGLVAEKTYYTDVSEYTSSTVELGKIESALAWGTADAQTRGVIVENVAPAPSGQGLVLKSLSRSGTLFCLSDLAVAFDYTPQGYPITAPGTWYSKRESATSGSDCKSLVWEPSSTGWAYS